MYKNILLSICCFLINPVISANGRYPIFVTPEDFGCISHSINSDSINTVSLQKAIDYCIQTGSKLVSTAQNKYYIKKGLHISGYINMDLGGATLVATDSIDVINILWNKTEYWTGRIRNFRIDLNEIGRIAINCEKAIKLHISEGEIIGIGEDAIGINVQSGYEVLVDKIHFHGAKKHSTGIKIITSDCHFTDCIMINCYTAVDNKGSNFYDRIHAWMLHQYINGSSFFKNRGGTVFLNQCFSDTYDLTFNVETACEMHISQLKLFHNKIMWKPPYDNVSPYLFYFSSQDIAKKSNITLKDSSIGTLTLDGQNKQKYSNIIDWTP